MGLIFAQLDLPPELEDEFNDWYDHEHIPERLGLPGFPEELPVQDDSRALLRRIKEAVDPAGIFAPGRYGF